MSIRQMNSAWDAECRSHTAKLVLVALADNANDSGVCWPSITSIAKKCGLSRQSVLDQIEHLEADKMISVSRGEKGKSNRYSMTIPVNSIDQSTPLTSQPDRPPLVNVVDRSQSTPLTEAVNVVDPNHQEPSFESPVEPPTAPGAPDAPSAGEGRGATDKTPTTIEAKRIAKLFNRKETTEWSPKEIKAFKSLLKRGVITTDALDALDAYYAAERAKGKDGWHRRDLYTFLNNFDGEVDRASARKPASHRAGQYAEQISVPTFGFDEQIP